MTYGYIYKALDGVIPKEELDKDKNHWGQLYKKRIGEIYSGHAFEDLSKRKDRSEAKTRATLHRPRALSQDLSSSETKRWIAGQVGKPRTFIRTWVRFVPLSG